MAAVAAAAAHLQEVKQGLKLPGEPGKAVFGLARGAGPITLRGAGGQLVDPPTPHVHVSLDEQIDLRDGKIMMVWHARSDCGDACGAWSSRGAVPARGAQARAGGGAPRRIVRS